MISTTEVEYMALSEVVTILMFIMMELQSMENEVELPITVYVDNIGAIFLANNCTTSDHTKHMDIYYHLIHEYVEDGMVKIKFVKSKKTMSIYLWRIYQAIYLKSTQRNWCGKVVDIEVQEGC